MLVDGKKIASEIKMQLKKEIEKLGKQLKLAIVFVGSDEVSRKFIERKIKFAEEIGVKTKIYNLPADISTRKLRQKIAEICHIKQNNGVIIQLPLPGHVKTQYILNGIQPKKDIDVLSSRAFGDFATRKSEILSPVVGAIKEIFDRNDISVQGKNIVVVGAGMLVGKPAAIWFINQSATVSVLNKNTLDISKFTKEADIIITGVGKPSLIKSEIVKDGVIIIDVGTASTSDFDATSASKSDVVVGDVAPEVAEKASVFTPVPGGVGPITVAMVFKNLLELNK